jgi:cyclophilin family peptidyl-prolyl cis-trans isomerase
MRFIQVLAPCLLLACSSNPVAGPDSGTPDSGGSDSSTPDSSSTNDGGDSGGGEYCPAGYTLTPFLTQTATTHTYSMAQQVVDPTKDYVAVLVTTAPGTLVWHFRLSTAPIASNSFIFLALNHFFDGIAFHRVVPGFVAQGGDPNTISGPRSTWGLGGPGYKFNDELTPAPVYTANTVSMANSGPNTNGSQFFIALADLSQQLGPDYTLFADLTEGASVLPLIATSPDAQGLMPPAVPTVMTDVHICQK